jgi:predicted amidohydrolase
MAFNELVGASASDFYTPCEMQNILKLSQDERDYIQGVRDFQDASTGVKMGLDFLNANLGSWGIYDKMGTPLMVHTSWQSRRFTIPSAI